MPHLSFTAAAICTPQADPWSIAYRVVHDLRQDGFKIPFADALVPDAPASRRRAST